MTLFLHVMEDNEAIMRAHDPTGRWGIWHEWVAPGGFELEFNTDPSRHISYMEAYEIALQIGLWSRTANVIAFDFLILLDNRQRIGQGKVRSGRMRDNYV